jgi:PAS domain S-box-containing protein
VVEASGAGLWEMDIVSGAVVADARMVELMAFRGALPMTFESGLASVHEDDAPRLSAAVQAALRGERGGRYQVEFRTGGTGDAPLRWVESRALASFDESGRTTRLAGAIVDVTARKEAELAREVLLAREVQARERLTVLSEQTKASETRLRLVTDALPVLVSFVTADERYGFVNKSYEDWFGQSPEEVVGRTVRDVIGESAYELLGPYVRRGLAGERFSFEQYNVPYRNGGTRDVHVTFVPLRIGAGPNGYVALIQDITVQRALEAERERLAAQRSEVLERQAQFEKQLIGIVSHDLRTPLNVISLSSARLARDDELSAGATKNVVRIQNAVHRAVRLVADLLDFTQARLGGGIPIERRATDVHALLDSLVTELEAAFPERRVECVYEGEGQGAWDPERITQLAQNLITNALKYSPEDSVVKVSTQRAADAISLRVHNLGAPIPTAQLTEIFEPLQRGHEHIDRVTRSVGLGLYIVKQIVEAHRGSVQVESSQDEGTTFVVSLPLA